MKSSGAFTISVTATSASPTRKVRVFFENAPTLTFRDTAGVGMGAVEAALYNKPVIITDYGAPKEYIKTPFLIECGRQEIEQDDFLFQKGMVWGKPDFEQLKTFMKKAYDDKVYYQDHAWTRDLINPEKVKGEIKQFFRPRSQDTQKAVSDNALVF